MERLLSPATDDLDVLNLCIVLVCKLFGENIDVSHEFILIDPESVAGYARLWSEIVC